MGKNTAVWRSMFAAGALLAVPAIASAATVVVSPANMGSWAFDNRDTNGIVGANPTGVGQMVTGPATPPLGTGSANLATGNGTAFGDGAAELRNTGYAGTLLSSITALSYSTYTTMNNGQQFPYLGLMVNWTGGSTLDDILFFEPPYQQTSDWTHDGTITATPQATALSTWQTWSASNGGWWWDSQDGVGCTTPPAVGCEGDHQGSLATYLAEHPDATIVNYNGLGGVRFDVGFASDTDQFNGYVDNFTIGDGQGTTTYDFEPSAVPEPATLGILGIALAGIGLVRRRRN